MKAFIHSVGDPSVGVWDAESTVESNFDITDGQYSNREEVREFLRDTFHEFHDLGRTEVYFEDECPDCLKLLIDGQCKNPNCISSDQPSLYEAIQEGDEETVKEIEEKAKNGEVVRII